MEFDILQQNGTWSVLMFVGTDGSPRVNNWNHPTSNIDSSDNRKCKLWAKSEVIASGSCSLAPTLLSSGSLKFFMYPSTLQLLTTAFSEQFVGQ